MKGFNFTERVRRILVMAREEAQRLDHEYVGTEHLLLGLLRDDEGVGPTALRNLRVDANAMRRQMLDILTKGTRRAPESLDLPYTSRSKKVLELAMTEAEEQARTYVGSEHLLMGLLLEEKGVAAQVLSASGVTVDAARAEIVRLIGQKGASAGTGPPEAEQLSSLTAVVVEQGAPQVAVQPITVQIEHPIRDLESWRAAFDSDPVGRKQAGVRRYRVMRPVNDVNRVVIELEFDNTAAAEAFLAAMRKVWNRVEGTLITGPAARILETVEAKEL